MRRGVLIATVLLVAGLVVPAPADAHTLTYGKARAAAQKRADAFAGQRAEITSLKRPILSWLRNRLHRYDAEAEWSYIDPTGCKGCVYDEATGTFHDGPDNVQCSVELIVRYRSHRSRRPVAVVDGHACF